MTTHRKILSLLFFLTCMSNSGWATSPETKIAAYGTAGAVLGMGTGIAVSSLLPNSSTRRSDIGTGVLIIGLPFASSYVSAEWAKHRYENTDGIRPWAIAGSATFLSILSLMALLKKSASVWEQILGYTLVIGTVYAGARLGAHRTQNSLVMVRF